MKAANVGRKLTSIREINVEKAEAVVVGGLQHQDVGLKGAQHTQTRPGLVRRRQGIK